jgi:hypothetical protein
MDMAAEQALIVLHGQCGDKISFLRERLTGEEVRCQSMGRRIGAICQTG